MLPLAHAMRRLRASLKDDRRHAALENMGCRGETNRTGTDDRDRLRSTHFILPSN